MRPETRVSSHYPRRCGEAAQGARYHKSAIAPVFEFRIADLVSSADVKKIGELYSAIIETGANTHTTNFIDPFKGEFYIFVEGTLSHDKLNKFVREYRKEDYAAFLRAIKLRASQFPQQYSPPLRRKPQMRVTSCAMIV